MAPLSLCRSFETGLSDTKCMLRPAYAGVDRQTNFLELAAVLATFTPVGPASAHALAVVVGFRHHLQFTPALAAVSEYGHERIGGIRPFDEKHIVDAHCGDTARFEPGLDFSQSQTTVSASRGVPGSKHGQECANASPARGERLRLPPRYPAAWRERVPACDHRQVREFETGSKARPSCFLSVSLAICAFSCSLETKFP